VIGAGVVVLAAAGWFLLSGGDKPGSASVPALASTSASAPGVATPASAPAVTPVPPVVAAATSAPTPAPAATPAPVAKPEFDPVRQLSDIVVARDAQIEVTAQAKQSQVKIGKDRIGFSITSAQAGYVYVLTLDTEHKHLYLMFPNTLDKKNRIEAGKTLTLPGPKWPLVASGPVGIDQYVVMVSQNERDFSAAGLEPGAPFAEIKLQKARDAYQTYSGAVPMFAGKAVCKAAGECANNYGAASFTIETVGKGKP
jgi:hypothetical protein